MRNDRFSDGIYEGRNDSPWHALVGEFKIDRLD